MIIGRRKRRRGYVAVAGVILAVFAGALVLRLFLLWNTPAEDPGRKIVLSIPPGSTFVSAARRLAEEGVVRSFRGFVLLGKVKGMSGSIQAGELLFDTNMTPLEVLDVLAHGKPVTYAITIPEGYTVAQIADALEKKGLARKERVLALAQDAGFARSLDLPAPRLEGFLFPDTYAWRRGLPEEDVLRTMVKRYRSVFDERLRARAQARGLSELEAVTLASIVEKETGAAQERRLVSAVFTNRLRKGYRLQTDPTVIYGIKGFDGNLTKEHLQTDHPYNTYTRGGLPPGPIANPGRASLEAAVDPEDVPYLYFVAKGDGTHVFTSTLEEHNQAVRIYQLGGGPT